MGKRPGGLNFKRSAAQRIRVRIYRRDGFACVSCGWCPLYVPLDYDGSTTLPCVWEERPEYLPYEGRFLTIDHRKPLSRGGTSHPRNLRTMCNNCNSSKGTRTVREWEI